MTSSRLLSTVGRGRLSNCAGMICMPLCALATARSQRWTRIWVCKGDDRRSHPDVTSFAHVLARAIPRWAVIGICLADLGRDHDSRRGVHALTVPPRRPSGRSGGCALSQRWLMGRLWVNSYDSKVAKLSLQRRQGARPAVGCRYRRRVGATYMSTHEPRAARRDEFI